MLLYIKMLPFYMYILYLDTLRFVCIFPAYSAWTNNYLYKNFYIKYLQPPHLNDSL